MKLFLRAWCRLVGHRWVRTVGLGFKCGTCDRPLVEMVALQGNDPGRRK